MTNIKGTFRKLFGLAICVVMLFGALYVPISFSAKAESHTTTFTFDTFVSNGDNANAANSTTLGYYGVGWSQKTDGTNKYLQMEGIGANNTYNRKSGYRIENNGQVYNLEPSATYVVSMKIQATEMPQSNSAIAEGKECVIKLGYNAFYNAQLAGNQGNYINTMNNTLCILVIGKTGDNVCTLNNLSDNINVAYSNTAWYEIKQVFTTPANMGTSNPALALFGESFSSFKIAFDDISVTKLGDGEGVVILRDEYSNKSEMLFGAIGDKANLPDVSDRAVSADHTFDGWFTDSDRTQRADNLTFTKDVQNVYSSWIAPITYVFNDTFNNKEYTVIGKPGETISYPADPVDADDKQYFMGWYTTEDCTEEFTNNTFGYSSQTFYSLWMADSPGLTQNFDEYKAAILSSEETVVSDYVPQTMSNGEIKKSNREYFSWVLERTNEVTYNSSAYSIKCDWKKNNTDTPESPSDINAAQRYNSDNMYMWLGTGLDNNTSYTLTFKYYLEKADTDVIFYAASAANHNSFGNSRKYGFNNEAAGFVASKSQAGQGWKEGKITFSTNYITIGTTMFLGFTLKANQDVLLYVDDVNIEATFQPSQASVIVNKNNGEENLIIKGSRGEKVNIPDVTHPDGAKFIGWYLDEGFTTPAENLVFSRKPVNIYAKWGPVTLTFNTYNFPTNPEIFGRLYKIDESGIGIDNDNALRIDFKGEYVYKYGCTVTGCGKRFNTEEQFNAHVESAHGGASVTPSYSYFNERVFDADHCFPFANNLVDGQLYMVTYNYKVLKANCSVYVNVATTNPVNIWHLPGRNVYSECRTSLIANSEWNTKTFFITPDIKDGGNTLALYLTLSNNNMSNEFDILFDNITVEKIDGNIVYFDDGNGGITTFTGNVGDSVTPPVVTHPEGVEFLGWYLDKSFTVPYTANIIGEGCTAVYAKWAPVPLTFKDYPYPTNAEAFGRLFSIDKNGNGINNDNALHFDYKGNYVYKYDCTCGKRFNTMEQFNAHRNADHGGQNITPKKTLFNTRTTDKDHCFTIKKGLNDKTLYKVTYYYRVLHSDTQISVNVATATSNNIWDAYHRTVYGGSATLLNHNSTEWQKNTFYVSTNFTGNGKDLMLYLTFGSAEDAVIDLYFDNILVEEVPAPYIFFDAQNGKEVTLLQGKEGEKITLPANPSKFGFRFTGWYTDVECKTPFTQSEFTEDTAITVYAGYSENTVKLYTFENYDIPYYMDVNKAKLQLVLARNVTTRGAASGSKVIEIDRTSELTHESFFVIADGDEVLKLNPENQYVVEFKYRIAEKLPTPISIGFSTAVNHNIYTNRAIVSSTFRIDTNLNIGQWYTASLLIDATKMNTAGPYLFMHATGDDGKAQIDDIKITTVKKGTVGVFVMNNGCSQIPTLIIGKTGASFKNKLPSNPSMPGKWFAGYYLMDAVGGLTKLDDTDMVFTDKLISVYAYFLPYKVTQYFDDGIFKGAAESVTSYSIHDFDYELYDSQKEGNSKDNVASGRYSLHRKGNSRYFESSVILTTGNTLSAAHTYTVTMKVKLGKHFHTDGAIKLHSNKSSIYAWSKTGDEHAIIPIKDLKEGEWVDVSYTFTSCEPYITLQTPGYVELFIDNIEFNLVTDPNVIPSVAKPYAEYRMLRRDESGNIIDFVQSEFDVSGIVDSRLKMNNGLGLVTIIVIAAGASIIIAGAVVLAIILAKKKKAKKKIKA